MKKLKKPEKACENCRFYLQHYVKERTGYISIFCGHCTHKDVKNYKKRPLELCENWGDIAIKKRERKQDIKEALMLMSKRLDDIVIILKDDMEN